MRRRGHPNIVLLSDHYPTSSTRSASEWRQYVRNHDSRRWETCRFSINITFASEADVLREQALRRELETHCPGLPRTDMFGWLAEGVPADPAQLPTPTAAQTPAQTTSGCCTIL